MLPFLLTQGVPSLVISSIFCLIRIQRQGTKLNWHLEMRENGGDNWELVGVACSLFISRRLRILAVTKRQSLELECLAGSSIALANVEKHLPKLNGRINLQ